MNKQSSIYTIVYIIVLAGVVGAVLAMTSMGLRERQQANIDADKMRQILSAIRVVPDKDMIAADFNKFVVSQLVVNEKGDSIGNDAFGIDMASESKMAASERRLPVYVCDVDGGRKYVVPVYGAGLWGPIWGYVSLDADGSTIYGAYFAHEGETPGLGAEIEKPVFSDQFRGKVLLKNGKFLPVNVLKKGVKPKAGEDYVDAVSGGTITSKGVASMLDDGLVPYKAYLQSLTGK
ncbi:MAG: NADH:ubiquinone reductase (Na(+)-transporting) subunit C [Muribaculaceae bacterium]|jgi:NADH:ubiquinone oxidoreductase, Na(+)-translocating, C subunit|nr:NADH:ubiquinone reductase (Na(+)-transporting) subunit C [Muribaculaceae bacterium]